MTKWNRDWLPRWIKGTPTARENLLRKIQNRFSPGLMQYLLKWNDISREDAEDILQDTWVKFHQKVDQYDSNFALSTWIYRITRNTALNHLRSKKSARIDSSHELDGEESHHSNPEPIYLRKEEKDFVRNFMQRCSHKEKEAAFLFYYEEMKAKEIAQVMGVAEGTIKSMLFRIRNKLKEAWKNEME